MGTTRRKAFIVQWYANELIHTRLMIATDVEKIYKKYPDIKRSDIHPLQLPYRHMTIEFL